MIFTVAVGAAVFYSAKTGMYPVAIVNGKIILARELKGISAAAYNFYARASETYGGRKLEEADTYKLSAEIGRAALDKLVEHELISGELRRRLPKTYAASVERKLELSKRLNLQAAASGIYGLKMDDFVGSVLEPQAAQEVLSDDLKSHGGDFNVWLQEAKKQAKVIIFSASYKWVNGSVEAR